MDEYLEVQGIMGVYREFLILIILIIICLLFIFHDLL